MIDTIKAVFLWVLFSSIAASIIALVIMLIKIIFRTRISSRAYCILWLLVVIKLIVAPFAPGSHISIFNLLDTKEISLQKKGTIPYASLPFINPGDKQLQLFWDSIINNKLYSNYNTTEKTGQFGQTGINDKRSGKEPANNGLRAFYPDIVLVLSIIWFAGFLITACIILYSGIAFLKELRGAERIDGSQLPMLVVENKYKMGIRGDIQVYCSSRITNPCIAGIIKPKIYIPQELFTFTDGQKLVHILMHEFAHIKRKDNLVNVVVAAVNVLHWFNPAIWYAFRLFNMDREVSCDTYALEILGQEESIPYGMTLINFSSHKPQSHFPLSFFSYCPTHKQIERRITMIKMFRKGSYKLTAAAIILCLAASTVTLTNAEDSGNNMNTASTSGTIQKNDSQSKFNLGGKTYASDSFERAKNEIERVKDKMGFAFKVPDIIPSYFEYSSGMSLDEKKFDNGNQYLLDMTFINPKNMGNFVQFQLSRGNLLRFLENIRDEDFIYTIKKEPMEVSGVKGTLLTSVKKLKPAMKSDISKYSSKEFIWQEEGVWYLIRYYALAERNGRSVQYADISLVELQQMVSSMKYPQDSKNYMDASMKSLSNQYPISIHEEKYLEQDLEQAEKMLGFAPKFPLSLPGGYSTSRSEVRREFPSPKDEEKTIYMMETVFEDITGSLKNRQDDFKRVVFFNQYQKGYSFAYDDLKNNGSIRLLSDTPIPVHSKRIAGTEVLFAEDTTGKKEVWKNNTVTYENTEEVERYYVWVQNDVCYEVKIICDETAETSEKTVEALITEAR